MDYNTMIDTSEYGSASGFEVDALAKALAAPDSTNDLYSTSGGVVTQQSLEGMLATLTLKESDFTFWKDINKIKAFSTVEEFDQAIGSGISDGGFVDEFANPEFRDPDIQKQIAIVKFLREGWQAGDVHQITNTIIDPRAYQQRQAMIRLLRNVNRSFYSGNSTWIPSQFDGLASTIAGSSSYQVRDLRGSNLTMDVFNIAGQIITEANGNAENASLYSSPAGMQNLHKIIESGASSTGDRKIVQMGQSGITVGGRINDIMTAFGAFNIRMDKVLGMEFEAKTVPQYYNKTSGTWTEGPRSDKAPSTPSISLTENASTTNSNFSAGTVRPSGVTYSYRVVARNNYGSSAACASVTAGSVVAGGSVSIEITPSPADSGSKTPSCFEIYSEKVAGSGQFRYMYTIAADSTNPLSAVTYVDKNDYIPGTGRMYVIDQTTTGEDRVLAFSQLAPIHNTDLAKTGPFEQGLINLYGTMKYYKPQALVEIRNIGVDQTLTNLFNTV